MPDGRKLKKPIHVIYQCSEDSAGDTIKPRLIAAGADCSNVAFIDEELSTLSLNDEMIRRAIADFNAKLLVIDPVQAYLGEADISNVGGMRRVLHQLSLWAARYDCAIVLVGHLNKRQSGKDIYRSLGSIDLIAAARSAMQIDRTEDDPDVMVLRHIKSSLAYKGSNVYFEIDDKAILKTQEKFYLADQALKYCIMGYRPTSVAAMLENIVYFELKRKGYDVYVGKNETKEIDFVAVRRDERIYVQVCLKLPDISDREIENLLEIKDHYPKYVVTMDELAAGNVNGIKICHLADFLLREDY